MVTGLRELIAGLHTDPQFGRCVMVGIGGVLTEALADVAFRLAPLDAVDAADMLDDLRSQALLGPLRGEPAVDRAALVDMLLALSRVADVRTRRRGGRPQPARRRRRRTDRGRRARRDRRERARRRAPSRRSSTRAA